MRTLSWHTVGGRGSSGSTIWMVIWSKWEHRCNLHFHLFEQIENAMGKFAHSVIFCISVNNIAWYMFWRSIKTPLLVALGLKDRAFVFFIIHCVIPGMPFRNLCCPDPISWGGFSPTYAIGRRMCLQRSRRYIFLDAIHSGRIPVVSGFRRGIFGMFRILRLVETEFSLVCEKQNVAAEILIRFWLRVGC